MSTRNRLQGKEREVKDDCKMYGWNSTWLMRKYGVGYGAWERYVRELFNGHPPEMVPMASLSDTDRLYDQIGAYVLNLLGKVAARFSCLDNAAWHVGFALVKRLQKLETENKQLRLELTEIKRDTELRDRKAILEAVGLANSLKEEYQEAELAQQRI